MGQKSAWLELKLSKTILGQTDSFPTVPGTWYVALSTAAWDVNATGTSMTEVVSGVGYARIAVTNDSLMFPAPTAAGPVTQSNAAQIDWATPSGDWGTIQSFYLCDDATAGNVWFGSDISTPFDVNTGGGASAPVGGILILEY